MVTTTSMLTPGTTVTLQTYRITGTVDRLLGSGGQGEVYEIHTRDSGHEHRYALKWYLPTWATREQWNTLESLVRLEPPSTKFLWPIDVVVIEGSGFGYVMPLRDPSFQGIVELMHGTITPSFRALTTSAYHLADAFLHLHTAGLCYRDINFGNIFLNPDTGDVLICDNDNVGIDGRAAVGVLGTERFMAPEVVRREALPSATTDLYSLSVLLFYLFMIHHPLEGRRELADGFTDAESDRRMFGTEPRFIWDPVDESNRPSPDDHANALAFWPIYPKRLRDLFTRAFTDGLRDPENGRVREGEWRDAALQLRDAIYYCRTCRAENYWDAEGPARAFCWSCHEPTSPPPRLVTGRGAIMLNHDTRVYPHHVGGPRWDFSTPAANVVQHPTQPDVAGLRNESAVTWQAATAGGAAFDVPPGRSCTLAAGTRIDFGALPGVILV